MKRAKVEKESAGGYTMALGDVVLTLGNINSHEDSGPMEAEISNLTLFRKINGLEKMMDSIDFLLQKLEGRVTRLAEEISNLKRMLEADEGSSGTQVSPEVPEGVGETEAEGIQRIHTRNQCIDAIMKRTVILQCNEEKELLVRGFYEEIYDTCPETSYILRILQKGGNLEIHFDCDSKNIDRLIEEVLDHDGNKKPGSDFNAFSDLYLRRVYVAGKPMYPSALKPVAFLAVCLMQMAMEVIFGNRGFPYTYNDKMIDRTYDVILDEVFAENHKSKNCCYFTSEARKMKTSFARGVSAVSLVPGVLVQEGIKEGISGLKILKCITPSLVFFMTHHVLPRMVAYLKE